MSDGTELTLGDISCQCPACSGAFAGSDAISTADMSDQVSTGDSYTDAVVNANGLKWGSTSYGTAATVSYSFLSSVPSYYATLSSRYYDVSYPSGFSSFNSSQ